MNNIRFLRPPWRILFLVGYVFMNRHKIEKEKTRKRCLSCEAPFTPTDRDVFVGFFSTCNLFLKGFENSSYFEYGQAWVLALV